MSTMSCWLLLSSLLLCTPGCTSTNPDVRVRRTSDGHIEVDGPMAGPFPSLEQLAETACDRMTHEPGASNGPYGFEYCALYYFAPEENAYYLSYLSDIRGQLDPLVKTCSLPNRLQDPTHLNAIILGGAHTHPNNREPSPRDLSSAAHWKPVRFFDSSTGRVWDRQLLVFFREKTGECRAYSYNNSTRVVSALRDKKWVPIGEVYDDMGYIRMYEGQDWVP